jgi:NADPH:quinone reductase-like Zn-dependent oxidoreductase
MNAAVVSSFDQPPRYTTFADPVAGEGERLVKVSAAALHQIVRLLASGSHYSSTGVLPLIAGIDGVGRLADGTRVYFGGGRPPFGTMAEYSLAPDLLCLPLPDALDDVTAAALVNPAMSSWAALSGRANFTAGESVLILGATGTSGQLAVQIAKRRGASRIIAAGRNPEVLNKLTSLGADTVISLDQPTDQLIAAFHTALAQTGIDIVLDYLWGPPAEALLAALTQKRPKATVRSTRFVQIGSMAGADIKLPAATLRSSAIELFGSGLGSVSLDGIREALTALFTQAAKQPFDFNAKAVPLADVEQLWNSPNTHERLVFQP